MLTLINGAPESRISVRDRGFLYGDGAFESLAIHGGHLVLLVPHLERLQKACTLLRIPFDKALLLSDIETLLRSDISDGVCKIMLTRGEGGRGYKADVEALPTRVVQYFEPSLAMTSEHGIAVGVSQHRLGLSAELAGIKHLNRLDQVMASFDLSPEAFEAICLDQQGRVIEGTRSNIIAVKDGVVVTPKLDSSGVRGIMLDALVAKFANIGKPVEFVELSLDDIRSAAELMFCNSVFGVWPVIKLLEGASVTQWAIGDISRQAIAFQHELFRSHIE
ncbi:MAG: 4-amino-4-deoxychorismate lyase [Pseudohongiellaceae bacterium]|jgi:4-amino-4-deoxychorismate lyase